MGMIRTELWGSFDHQQKLLGPAVNGHAALVAEMIQWLSEKVLPEAIALDHKLHSEGRLPPEGWG
jgi:hypothetical protein